MGLRCPNVLDVGESGQLLGGDRETSSDRMLSHGLIGSELTVTSGVTVHEPIDGDGFRAMPNSSTEFNAVTSTLAESGQNTRQ